MVDRAGGCYYTRDKLRQNLLIGKRKEILIPSVFHRPVGVAAPSGGEQTKGWIKVSASHSAGCSGVGVSVNADKPHLWKADIAHSIDFYNDWFMQFAPQTYRDTRAETTKQVTDVLQLTAKLTSIAPEVLRENPTVLPILRMTTAPPIARDRLIGLARVAPGLVKSMEVEQRIPPRMLQSNIDADLRRIGEIIAKLTDRDLFPWLEHNQQPIEMAVQRAATVVADRL